MKYNGNVKETTVGQTGIYLGNITLGGIFGFITSFWVYGLLFGFMAYFLGL